MHNEKCNPSCAMFRVERIDEGFVSVCTFNDAYRKCTFVGFDKNIIWMHIGMNDFVGVISKFS